MRKKDSVWCISSSLFLLMLFVSQANAAAYKWVDENGETQFGDRVPEQYRGVGQEVRIRSDATKRKDTHAAEPSRSRHVIPGIENPSLTSNEEWERRIREMETQRREAEERTRAEASKPRKPTRAVPEPKSTQEDYEDYMAPYRKAQIDNAKRHAKKRKERPKTYEEKMEEYKASQHCWDRARNVNGTTNAAVAARWGCKNVKRPRRD